MAGWRRESCNTWSGPRRPGRHRRLGIRSAWKAHVPRRRGPNEAEAGAAGEVVDSHVVPTVAATVHVNGRHTTMITTALRLGRLDAKRQGEQCRPQDSVHGAHPWLAGVKMVKVPHPQPLSPTGRGVNHSPLPPLGRGVGGEGRWQLVRQSPAKHCPRKARGPAKTRAWGRPQPCRRRCGRTNPFARVVRYTLNCTCSWRKLPGPA